MYFLDVFFFNGVKNSYTHTYIQEKIQGGPWIPKSILSLYVFFYLIKILLNL